MKTPNLPPALAAAAQAIGIGIRQSLETAVPHSARCKCHEAGYVEMCDEMRNALLSIGLGVTTLGVITREAGHAVAVGLVPVSKLRRGRA